MAYVDSDNDIYNIFESEDESLAIYESDEEILEQYRRVQRDEENDLLIKELQETVDDLSSGHEIPYESLRSYVCYTCEKILK